VTTEPQDTTQDAARVRSARAETAPAAGSRGRHRASRADREHAIELLKSAFVQERLTKDELETRVALALGSRTYADLAELTADLPAGPAHAAPAHAAPAYADPAYADPAYADPAYADPAAPSAVRPPGRTLVTAVRRAGLCLLAAFALIGVMFLSHSELIQFVAALGIIGSPIAASGFLGYGIVDTLHERRARGQLPPPSRRPGQAPAIATLTLGQTRPDQPQADLRAHSSPRRRPAVLADLVA
jgi:hypothetical protein